MAGVELLRAFAELHALKLLDKRLQPTDFAIAGGDRSRHVAHQALQELHVGRKIVQIEPHARFWLRST